jgi:hypothetical protein
MSMFRVTVTEKEGQAAYFNFEALKSEISIGRVKGNDIVLPKGNVSKRHSRIVVKDGKFIVVDLKSTNGTFVNGRKILSPQVIKSEDKVYIGDFVLSIDPDVDPAEAARMGPNPEMVGGGRRWRGLLVEPPRGERRHWPRADPDGPALCQRDASAQLPLLDERPLHQFHERRAREHGRPLWANRDTPDGRAAAWRLWRRRARPARAFQRRGLWRPSLFLCALRSQLPQQPHP